MIEYTAKRSLAPGHVAGQVYTLDLDIVEAVPNVVDVRGDARSAGGAVESTFERQDVYWIIDTAPFSGEMVKRVIEFLDSIESGETFRVWLTDGDIVPLALKQEGEAGAVESFMRTGSAERDVFTARFTALQAAPYDITGLQAGGDGGFSGGDSDPVDLYDPETGGGELDEDEGPELVIGPFVIVTGQDGNEFGYKDPSSGDIGSLLSDGGILPPLVLILDAAADTASVNLQKNGYGFTAADVAAKYSHVNISGIGDFDLPAPSIFENDDVLSLSWSYVGDPWSSGLERTITFVV